MLSRPSNKRADNPARLRWMFWIIQKTSWIIISNGKNIRGSDPIPATLRIDPLGPILHCSPRIPPFQPLFSHSISSTSTILLLIPWRIDLVGCCQTTLESTPTHHHSSSRVSPKPLERPLEQPHNDPSTKLHVCRDCRPRPVLASIC